MRPLARGGLGEVFVARDASLNREVALKLIQKSQTADPQGKARFLLEAEITGGLEHPGIVPVYALGESADGRPFYSMRLVRGETLKERIRKFHERRIDPPPIARISPACSITSSAFATSWPTPIAAACSIAT